jgi:hypothetical protein
MRHHLWKIKVLEIDMLHSTNLNQDHLLKTIIDKEWKDLILLNNKNKIINLKSLSRKQM